MTELESKPWYVRPWGIVIAVLFFPIFITWYSWTKTTWNKPIRIIVSILMAFVVLSIIGANISNKPTSNTVAQATSTPLATPVPTPTPYAVIYDVPSLLGKNIDQLRTILGTPTDNPGSIEPTAEQKALGGDEWSNNFSKNGQDILVTYFANSRKVEDFFVGCEVIGADGSTTNTQALMQVTNTKQGASNYTVEFVKAIKEPSKFTGIKITPN